MTEEEALAKMIAPGTPRPGKPRSGVLQVHLTRACNLACYGCTQGSNLAGKTSFMSLDHFEQACESLATYWGTVGIFGGSPTLHPQFDAICAILSKYIPFEQRGLWTNSLHGWGEICRRTFNPSVSNLNCHLDMKAYEEFRRDWPESRPFGHDRDSRHSPPYVALKDVVPDEGERWKILSDCPINRHWSAMIGVFRGQLRAWFCEIAGAQSILHQDDPDYPDTGSPLWVTVGRVISGDCFREGDTIPWWMLGMDYYADQVRKHCHDCGVPLQGYGSLAQAPESEGVEQVSKTHEAIYKPKRKDRRVELVMVREQLGTPLKLMTDYLGNAKR